QDLPPGNETIRLVDDEDSIRDFHMTGGTFDGIIWIEGGRFMMSGNGLVNGSIFANSDPTEQTKITGNCDIYYNQTIVEQILSAYNITPDKEIKILSWDN
ncbi:MAG: hypothetical protein HQ554_01680, partial [FCB group bacterium]|nr:hypothetical protein [FCB group bacterium]